MTRLVLAGMIAAAVFVSSGRNGDLPGRTQGNTPCIRPLAGSLEIDEWSLWNGPTQLRGANTWQKRPNADTSTVYPRYTQEDLCKLASWGANYVNLSIPGPMTEEADGRRAYHWDARVWANLDSMITRADSAGLFVVVSFRTGPGRSEWVFDQEEPRARNNVWRERPAQDAWVRMWGRTAELLRNRPAVVGYDLMVEPLLRIEAGSVEPRHWYRLAERLVDTIRKVDPATPIIVSVAPGGYPSGLRNLDTTRFKPNTRRIVFAVHQYTPWTYTHQPTTHSLFTCDTPRIARGDKSAPRRPFDPSVRAELQGVYTSMKRWKDEKGVSLVVNEFGVTRWVDSADVFIREQMESIEALPANHAVWLWDPEKCLGWDAMNFRNGPDSAYHFEVPNNALADSIRSAWRRNTVRPPR